MRAGPACTAGQLLCAMTSRETEASLDEAAPTHHVADALGGLDDALASSDAAGARLLVQAVTGRRERDHVSVRARAAAGRVGDVERLSDLSVEVGVEGGDAGHVVEGGFSEVLVEHGRWLLIDAALMPSQAESCGWGRRCSRPPHRGRGVVRGGRRCGRSMQGTTCRVAECLRE